MDASTELDDTQVPAQEMEIAEESPDAQSLKRAKIPQVAVSTPKMGKGKMVEESTPKKGVPAEDSPATTTPVSTKKSGESSPKSKKGKEVVELTAVAARKTRESTSEKNPTMGLESIPRSSSPRALLEEGEEILSLIEGTTPATIQWSLPKSTRPKPLDLEDLICMTQEERCNAEDDNACEITHVVLAPAGSATPATPGKAVD